MKKPTLRDDAEAARFWESHEPLDYISETDRVKTPRAPKTQAISLRLDPTILGLARRMARRKGIGYQTLIKIWITEAVAREVDRGATREMDSLFRFLADPFIIDTAHMTFSLPKLLQPKSGEISSAPEELHR